MKKLLVLGAGTAGTMVVNKLRHRLDTDEWQITVVDQNPTHYYQPGFLFIPFGMYGRHDVVKPKRDFIPAGVEMIQAEIEEIEADNNRVRIEGDRWLDYDFLVIASGTHIVPDETPGLEALGDEGPDNVHTFYTLEGAMKLEKHLRTFRGGKLVMNITELPFKCPVAPLEFIFLADWWLQKQGLREDTELTFVTPLPGAFTKPVASKALGGMLEDKKIGLVPDFNIEQVDLDANKIIAFSEEEVDYDLLVSVPLNMGAEFVGRSGLGDELNHVPVDKHNFLSRQHDNVFALGDAAALPTSKAGSVAHFAVELWTENFLRYIDGLEMLEQFDGHANCYIESGHGKGLLIDFNYDTEPLPGKYPLPGIGPFSLLEETEMNHWGKLMFRWMYWNILLKGKEMPVPALMSMAGKWSAG
jgi:sulfide:quinone oxidoreductase